MSFRRFAILILLLLLVTTIGFMFYVRSHGFSARSEPSRVEAFVARRVRSFAIPREARNAWNPVVYSPEVLSEAMSHFADHCATCHANDGSGKTLFGKGLYPRPPDMRQSETQNLTDGEIYWIIHNGVRFTGMPAFGEDKPGMPDEDSWKLVHFVRHLPKITEEELQTMKALNPKSPADLEEEEQIRKFLAGEDTSGEKPTHHH
jgi:Cytochrome C oxidase, cbb3-type, subunit III